MSLLSAPRRKSQSLLHISQGSSHNVLIRRWAASIGSASAPTKPLDSILIANRGEIALSVMLTDSFFILH